MINWFTNKIIDGYVKAKVKELQKIDIKKKVFEYINDHKEEVIEKIKETIDKAINALVSKAIEKFEDKIQK